MCIYLPYDKSAESVSTTQHHVSPRQGGTPACQCVYTAASRSAARCVSPRPVGRFVDRFGAKSVPASPVEQSTLGGVFSGRPTSPKTASHCDSTETGQAPPTACITPLLISGDMVGSRHTRPENMRLIAADVLPPSAVCNNWALVQRTRPRRVTIDSVCDRRLDEAVWRPELGPALPRGPSRPAPCL